VKIWVTILSFTVLFFSTVPCSAYDKQSECAVEKNCENDSQKCGNDCSGKCSPFYSCGSCIGFTLNFGFTPISEKLDFSTDEIVQPLLYDKFVYSSFICKIWQPPKNT
jgi:hypothetical protein